MYVKKLYDLKNKLISAYNAQNEVTAQLKSRHEENQAKRADVNELMVKSRLVEEADLDVMKKDTDPTPHDLPEEIDTKSDKLLSKLNSITKHHKKHKRKNRNNRSMMDQSRSSAPRTRNALKLKKKLSQEDLGGRIEAVM